MTRVDLETLTRDGSYVFGYTVGGIEIDARVRGDRVEDVTLSDPDVMTLKDGVAKELQGQIQEWLDARTTSQELDEAEAKLTGIEQESRTVNDQVKRMEEQLKTLQERQKELVGGPWSRDTSEVQQQRRLVVALQRKLDHEQKPRVVWKSKSEYTRNEGQIVAKVTAKRIYVCLPGHTSHDLYNKDGTPVSDWRDGNEIDIKATFGGPCPEKMK